MKLKITEIKLIDFNLADERARIKTAFRKNKDDQQFMTSVLDLFEAGEFDKLADDTKNWSRDRIQYLHPVIYETLVAVLNNRNKTHNISVESIEGPSKNIESEFSI